MALDDAAFVGHPDGEADDCLEDDDPKAPDVDGPVPEFSLDV